MADYRPWVHESAGQDLATRQQKQQHIEHEDIVFTLLSWITFRFVHPCDKHKFP